MTVNKRLSECLYSRVTPLGRVRCYDVAWAVLALSEMAGAFYIEGGATFRASGRSFKHGWLELDGEIVDPVWYMHDLDYVPRYRIPKAAAVRLWQENDRRLPLDDGMYLA
jgi:hypothetical protein